MKAVTRIHFIGMGGIGMCGLAELMLKAGYNVQGSDAVHNPQLQRLQQLGVRVFVGQRVEQLQGAQAVVYSLAVPPDNVELQAARQQGLPCVSRPELVTQLINAGPSIAITGAHGKTTTTAMVASVLWGCKPLHLLMGGVWQGLGSTAYLSGGAAVEPAKFRAGTVGNGARVGTVGSGAAHTSVFSSVASESQIPLFVVEADESDGFISQMRPLCAVITNIDNEHLNHYGSVDKLKAALLQLVQNTQQKNKVFYGAVRHWLQNQDTPSKLQPVDTMASVESTEPVFDIFKNFINKFKSNNDVQKNNKNLSFQHDNGRAGVQPFNGDTDGDGGAGVQKNKNKATLAPLIVGGDDPELYNLFQQADLQRSSLKPVFYGFKSHNDWRLKAKLEQNYEVWHQNKFWGLLQLPLPGRHNALNALAACIVGQGLGLEPDLILKQLAQFKGVGRRMQHKGALLNGRVQVYDDYAHHPTEIKALLEAMKDFFNLPISVLFQPHKYSRTVDCWHEFKSCFNSCDQLFIVDTYACGEAPVPGRRAYDLAQHIQHLRSSDEDRVGADARDSSKCLQASDEGRVRPHPKCQYVGSLFEAQQKLQTDLPFWPRGVLLTLGAGDVYKVGEGLLGHNDEKSYSTQFLSQAAELVEGGRPR